MAIRREGTTPRTNLCMCLELGFTSSISELLLGTMVFVGRQRVRSSAGSLILLMRWYTRTMMDFLLFHEAPERIVMIGLGGGSMPKWCYQQLSATDITVIEISPMVISLREQFYIPADDERFRVLCGDGADYVATTESSPEVLLVDGFDIHGQSPQLCSQEFYEDCYPALASDGVMVVNLCGPGHRQLIDRIRRAFDDRVHIVIPEDGENKVVFAVKGRHHWIEDEPIDKLAKRFRADSVLIPSLTLS
jgi:spermidine synthase